jgi:MFS family permease
MLFNFYFRGIVTGMFAIGGLLGALTNSYMSNKFGRRDSMIIMNVNFFIGAILLSLATTSCQLALGHIFVGIGSGFMNCVISIYVSEIAPSKHRGALIATLQLSTTAGILIIECISLGLNNSVGWRIVVAITTIPATIQMIALPFCARSPRWLINQNRTDEARIALLKLRNGNIETEFADMISGLSQGSGAKLVYENDKDSAISLHTTSTINGSPSNTAFKPEPQLSIVQFFSVPVLPLLTSKLFVLHALSQLTGINAIMYYSTNIFEYTFGAKAKYVTIGIAILNVFVTIIAILLVDYLGRKTLLLISSAGMTISCVIMTIALGFNTGSVEVTCVLLYVGYFAIGFGLVPSIITVESFPTYAVSSASSGCLIVNWFCNFIIGLFFPAMLDHCDHYAFLIFAGIALSAFIFICFFIQETKQKSIDEIGRQFGWYGIDVNEILNKKHRH